MQNSILAVTSDFSNMKVINEEAGKRDMRVRYTYSMNEAFELLGDNDYVLVAIRADGIDYLSKLKLIRDLRPMPIIVFSYTYDAISDKAEALKVGADVFIATPFALEYIIESGLALIRMYERLGGKKRLVPGSILSYDHILLSTQTRTVYVKGDEVTLSRIEFDLLRLLMKYPGNVLSYRQIYTRVWGNEYVDNIQKVIWNHVYRLRQKLKTGPEIPDYISTVKEIGYKLARIID